MKDNKHIQSFNEHQENLNISDVRSSLYQLKKHLEDKRISDKETLKYFKQIESGIKNLEMYDELYSDLGEEIFNLHENGSSLSEIGEYVWKHYNG
jgi:hypothetical protein